MARAGFDPTRHNPDVPLPGAKARMKYFDSLPPEIRRYIAENACVQQSLWQPIVDRGLRLGHKHTTIIKNLEELFTRQIARNPAERESAQAFLKDLGL